MRIVRIIAAFVALATVAFAVGDFASDPNALGALGLVLLIGVFAALLAYLFRPEAGRERSPERPPPPPEPPRRRRSSPSAGVWAEGWDASEADRARERRK